MLEPLIDHAVIEQPQMGPKNGPIARSKLDATTQCQTNLSGQQIRRGCFNWRTFSQMLPMIQRVSDGKRIVEIIAHIQTHDNQPRIQLQ